MYVLTVTTAMIDHCVDGELWSRYSNLIEKYGESAATNIFIDFLYDEIFDVIQRDALPEIRPLLWDILEIIFDDIDESALNAAALEKIREQKRDSWRVI
ncbi:MAG: hypothetical protein ACI39G_00225 [Pseudoramibacter sp.]